MRRKVGAPKHMQMRVRRLVLAYVLLVLALGTLGCSPGASVDAGKDASASGSVSHATTLVSDFHNTDLGCGWTPVGNLDLRYAQRFAIDYYEGGYTLACLADSHRYLMVPEGAEVPQGLADDIVVLQKPADNIYLAASDSMCLFEALGAMDRITVSGIARDDWQIEAARTAMDEGRIVYGGKYRAPDYELLLERGVRLSIQSSMINHAPDVREKLMSLGIPVLVELSSYESEPLGRAEWILLYGELCDCPDLARHIFDEQVEQVAKLQVNPTGKTVAYFYLNANGMAVVRRPGDYVTKMIEQAGGTYAFDSLDAAEAGSSSATMEMEQFYAQAKDADVIVYNATIDNGPTSLDELIARNKLLADFKAVRSGDVWVTEQNMYQQMIRTGDIIADFNHVLCGDEDGLTYLRRLS